MADASRASQARLDLLDQQGHPDRKERPAHPDRKERPAHPDRGERPAHPDRGENPVRPVQPQQRLQQNRRNKVVSEFTSATQRARSRHRITPRAASACAPCRPARLGSAPNPAVNGRTSRLLQCKIGATIKCPLPSPPGSWLRDASASGETAPGRLVQDSGRSAPPPRSASSCILRPIIRTDVARGDEGARTAPRLA